MTNTPKLTDGTPIKAGMFTENGVQCFYVSAINKMFDCVYLMPISRTGSFYLIDDIQLSTRSFDEMATHSLHIVNKARLLPILTDLSSTYETRFYSAMAKAARKQAQ